MRAHRPLQAAYASLVSGTEGGFATALRLASVVAGATSAAGITRALVRRQAWPELGGAGLLSAILAVSAALGPTSGEIAHAFEYGGITAVLIAGPRGLPLLPAWTVVSLAGLADEAIEAGGALVRIDSGDVLRNALGAAIACVVVRGLRRPNPGSS